MMNQFQTLLDCFSASEVPRESEDLELAFPVSSSISGAHKFP